MDGAEEVAGDLVVAGSNAAILLELVEELLDQVTGPVQVLVIFARLFCGCAWEESRHLGPRSVTDR